jgi:hypothetical protein
MSDFFITIDNKARLFNGKGEFDLTAGQLAEYDKIRSKYPKELNAEIARKLDKEIRQWQKKIMNTVIIFN